MSQTAALKPLASIKDESLDTNLQGKLHLSIQSGQGSLVWALFNTGDTKYLALESYSYAKAGEEEVLAQLKTAPWFANVTSVSLALVSDKITLVPEPLFDEKVKSTYASFNFETDGSDVVLSAKVRSAGCMAVFALSQEKEKLYRSFFPAIKIIHATMALLESVLTTDKNESSEKAYLHIRPKSMELVFTKNGSLLYYNTFSHTTSEDVIYYLLFALEQLKLNPETIALQLMGEVEKNDGVYSIIHKYVRNVSFMPRTNRFEFSYRFSELPDHAFYTLYSQYLCA
jgi:hypothetical protein